MKVWELREILTRVDDEALVLIEHADGRCSIASDAKPGYESLLWGGGRVLVVKLTAGQLA